MSKRENFGLGVVTEHENDQNRRECHGFHITAASCLALSRLFSGTKRLLASQRVALASMSIQGYETF